MPIPLLNSNKRICRKFVLLATPFSCESVETIQLISCVILKQRWHVSNNWFPRHPPLPWKSKTLRTLRIIPQSSRIFFCQNSYLATYKEIIQKYVHISGLLGGNKETHALYIISNYVGGCCIFSDSSLNFICTVPNAWPVKSNNMANKSTLFLAQRVGNFLFTMKHHFWCTNESKSVLYFFILRNAGFRDFC